MSHWIKEYLKCQFIDSKAKWLVPYLSAINIIICIKMSACVLSNEGLFSAINDELLAAVLCLYSAGITIPEGPIVLQPAIKS